MVCALVGILAMVVASAAFAVAFSVMARALANGEVAGKRQAVGQDGKWAARPQA